jgi:hypothetical protein
VPIVMLTTDANPSNVRSTAVTARVITRGGTTLTSVSTVVTMLWTPVFAGIAERTAFAVAGGRAGGLATDKPYHAEI